MCKKSESIANLAIALVKFNTEVTTISKDAENPFFKNDYATLDHIMNEVRPTLSKHGLSILQLPSGDGTNVSMKTLILHESGEWLESEALIMKPVKNDPQSVGSCITYARRYSIASVLSLSTGEDDDGNAATHTTQPKKTQETRNTQSNTNTSSQQQTPTTSQNVKLATESQVKLLRMKRKFAGWDSNEFINAHFGWDINSLTEVPASEVNKLIQFLDQNKAS